MFELYAEFIGKNEKKIIDDFCVKIKKELIGDLTLDEYSRFRFWKDYTSESLKKFHKKYKKDTKKDVSYDIFCELMWESLDNMLPEEIKKMLNVIKGVQIAEA